jgi:hypothetical protein
MYGEDKPYGFIVLWKNCTLTPSSPGDHGVRVRPMNLRLCTPAHALVKLASARPCPRQTCSPAPTPSLHGLQAPHTGVYSPCHPRLPASTLVPRPRRPHIPVSVSVLFKRIRASSVRRPPRARPRSAPSVEHCKQIQFRQVNLHFPPILRYDIRFYSELVEYHSGLSHCPGSGDHEFDPCDRGFNPILLRATTSIRRLRV